MKIRGAIFDLDGTLTDSMYIWDQIPYTLVRRHNRVPDADLAERLKQMGRREASAYLIREYRLPVRVEELMEEINQIVDEEYRRKVRLKPGVPQLLSRMSREGILLCVATASETSQAEAALSRLGVWDNFQFALSCIQCGGKTKPDIYQMAAKRLGTRPEETVVFEDALHAAATAKSAGFPVTGVYDDSAKEDQEELSRLCDWYLIRLDDWRMKE